MFPMDLSCPRGIVSLLLLVGACLPTFETTAVAADIFAVQALQRHLDSGRLPARVKQQLDQTGRAEVLVTLAADDVEAETARLRGMQRVAIDTDAILQEKVQLLQRKKERLLAALNPADHDLLTVYSQGNVPAKAA